MFRRLLLVFTDAELRLKLLKIIGLLIFARFLAHVPIPILRLQDISQIDNDQVFALLNTVSGGSYGRLSFIMLGVGPYITASIVIQLLGVIVPKIREIQKEEGQAGQQKINRWTRFLAVPLAALQSWGILQFLAIGSPDGGVKIELPEVLTRNVIDTQTFWSWFLVITAMTAGSIIMMWIGEIITEFKMGNGISLIILSGIVVRLPEQISKFFGGDGGVIANIGELFNRFSFEKIFNLEVLKAFLWSNPTWDPIRVAFWFLFIFVTTLLLVVFVNDAVRRLTVIYSRRGHTEGKSRTLENVKADLPIKVNMAGVLPIIFAVSFVLFPAIMSRFFLTANIKSVQEVAKNVETYLSTNPTQNIPTSKLPSEFLGFYNSSNPLEVRTAIDYDTTAGQDLFGFTFTTFNADKDYNAPVENATNEELKKAAKKDIKNVFFNGTPIRFELPSYNPGFIPEFAIHWNGILAYTFFYFLLIIFFTYFYTANIAFKTDEIAENLQKNSGAYIPGYRPGTETADYLSYLSNRLNVAGSIFLALIAIIPLIFSRYIQFGDGTLTGVVGGTTLLILVSVTIETLKQIEAQATAVDYERFTK
jgi:preprotein translocase subunit SecY